MEPNQIADSSEKSAKAVRNLRKWIWPLTIVIVWASVFLIPIILAERHGMIPEAIKNAPANGYKVSYDFGLFAAIREFLQHDFSFHGWVIIYLTATGVFALMVTPLISKFLDHRIQVKEFEKPQIDPFSNTRPEVPRTNESKNPENGTGGEK